MLAIAGTNQVEVRLDQSYAGNDNPKQQVDLLHENVEVTLLRIHVPRLGDHGDAVEAAEAAEALDRLRQRFPKPEKVRTVVRTIVSVGGVDTAILNAASELGASVIAISTHGHSAKYHVFMGSTALGVLRLSTLPLLLVRSAPAATS